MDQQQIIDQIERRAKALGLSMRFICIEADVHPTTFSRWKKSAKNPEPIGATLASLCKLDDALTAKENAASSQDLETAA